MTGEQAAELANVQYVDKQRGIAVVLEGEGGDLKGDKKVGYSSRKWTFVQEIDKQIGGS